MKKPPFERYLDKFFKSDEFPFFKSRLKNGAFFISIVLWVVFHFATLGLFLSKYWKLQQEEKLNSKCKGK